MIIEQTLDNSCNSLYACLMILRVGKAHVLECFGYGVACISLGFYIIWKAHLKVFKQKAMKLLKEHSTPSRYTVMVSGIPPNSMINSEEFLKTVLGEESTKICRTSFALDIEKYVSLQTKLFYLNKSVAKFQALQKMQNGYVDPYLTIEAIEAKSNIGKFFLNTLTCGLGSNNLEQIKKSQTEVINEMKELIEKSEKEKQVALYAFITFKNSEDCYRIIQQNKGYGMFSKITGLSKSKYKESSIYIDAAPEPEDIVWENLNVSFAALFKKSIVVYFLCFIVIAVSFSGNYILAWIKHKVNHLRLLFC